MKKTGIETTAGCKDFEEAKATNMSLLALGNVIQALADNSKAEGNKAKMKHVPYRDSKLTRCVPV